MDRRTLAVVFPFRWVVRVSLGLRQGLAEERRRVVLVIVAHQMLWGFVTGQLISRQMCRRAQERLEVVGFLVFVIEHLVVAEGGRLVEAQSMRCAPAWTNRTVHHRWFWIGYGRNSGWHR